MTKRGKNDQPTLPGFVKVGDIVKASPRLKKLVKPPSATQFRIIEAAANLDPQTILFQHTVFCQVGLPYRDPGNDARIWERKNGNVHLKIKAGEAADPKRGELVEIGLPFGTKPRLILADINTHAIQDQSPHIDIEKSLTRFVKRMQLDPKGRNIRAVKEAFTRLSACSMTMGLFHEGHAQTFNSNIISAFDIWLAKDDRQRILWPSFAVLSHEYFQILLAHAVPLDEAAYIALSHSALAMDVYAWLAQRLHRVHPRASSLVTWVNLHAQFGWHYDRLRDFRRAFNFALRQVKAVYQAARIDVTEEGLILWNSPPPVKKTQVLLP